MESESSLLAALLLGFMLGLKHATDADHVVAISAIASEYKNVWKGIWVGGSWGIGHTTPLLILGIAILVFKETVLEIYEGVSPILEFGVGIMLVVLGIQVYWTIRKGRLHLHSHNHDGSSHIHIHATHEPSANPNVEKSHGFFNPGKPFFRLKSYVTGMIHGFAGSAAIMLLMLPTISSPLVGIGYLLLFGAGTILSKSIITMILGIPFALSNGYQKLNILISSIAGIVSIIFGLVLMSDIVLNTAINPL